MPSLHFALNEKMLVASSRAMPAYTVSIAARYLDIPVTTIRAWFFGMSQGKSNEWFKPIFAPADETNKLLSFDNLAEAYIYRLIRSKGIRPDRIRKALKKVSKEFKSDHPLLLHRFLTDGAELFIATVGRSLPISSPSQLFFEWYEQSLERVEWRDSLFSRFYPITRLACDYELDIGNSPKVIVIDPDIAFGATAIARRGVPTQVVASRYFAGEAIQSLAEDFRCNTIEIEEAIRSEWKFSRGSRAA